MSAQDFAASVFGQVPGLLFVDHIAIAVLPGELEGQVAAYTALGFRELHREEMGGRDQVREVLLQIGNSPNLIQLLEQPLRTLPRKSRSTATEDAAA